MGNASDEQGIKGRAGFEFLSAYKLITNHIKANYPESIVVLMENAEWFANRLRDDTLQVIKFNIKNDTGVKTLKKTAEFTPDFCIMQCETMERAGKLLALLTAEMKGAPIGEDTPPNTRLELWVNGSLAQMF